jgi:hypothetical protein
MHEVPETLPKIEEWIEASTGRIRGDKATKSCWP